MTSSSSSMNLQKPLKVKSRWYQSTQMEMMMEESQSSLDMSDNVTDVSTSDMNENADYSSELKSVELRRSRRTGNSRTDYRRLNGSKSILPKTSLAFKTSTKKGRKKKEPLNTSDIGKEDKLKTNISEDLNVIFSLVDWNNVTPFQSKKLSKSVNNVNEIKDQSPNKSIRRTSLSWEFRFMPKNEVGFIENNINILNNNMLYTNSYETKYLGVNSSNEQLYKDVQESNTKSTANEHIPQQMHDVDNNSLVYEDNAFRNEVSNIELDQISATNSNKLQKSAELNKHTYLYNAKKTYQANHVINFSYELENLVSNPIYDPKKIRSKSCDSLQTSNSITRYYIKRSKSCDDINKLENSAIEFSKLQNLQKKSLKKKRRQSKRIKPKDNCIEILDDMKVPDINYDQEAGKIYDEHKNQLLEARNNDKEFDEKLKFTNFTLINENVYRPNRQTLKLYPAEIPTLRKLKQRVISGDINDYCECTLLKEDIVEGKMGCGDRCLNRLLKVECGSSCSLKRYCTNKQFQNKQFKKTNIIKTEKKGYGICAVEDIPKGNLISEYVGEVIDYNEMCNRLSKKEYKNLNYMIQLNHDEIIDSTYKGNVTRFINHSCDPNAIGEKWCVLGQSRIGFFSTRDIKKGEEITFDYSFRIFGNDPQVCYCDSSKCRGYISKAPQTTELSSSENSDDNISENHDTSKTEEKQGKIILKKRTAFNEKNKLRELSRQLTEIAKLKTGNRADQEMATLNLNRLMVHTTDSVNRLHVLKFIREQDVNKRLFMDFSGLSIIHNWMTSNENESFKLMILEILAELPITNRNTITKSKVLDVVAQWAEIPQDIKAKIESLEYPASDLQKRQEIDNIFPTNNDNNETTLNDLVKKSRDLWKKWIVLKMLFKIPKKIDNHKPCKEVVNLNENVENYYLNSQNMDVTTMDRKTFKMSNKYFKKARNQQIIPPDRIKLRKEFEFKVEQEQQKLFRKKVMDDWYDKMEGVMKRKSDVNGLPHQQSLNLLSCNTGSKYNNEFTKPTRWDCSSQVTQIRQNSMVNYGVQDPHLNFILPQTQPFHQFPQYSYPMPPQIFSEFHPVEQPCLNNSLQPLPNHLFTTQLLHCNSNTLLNHPQHLISEPSNKSSTCRLTKKAETNVFKLINDSLYKHCGSGKNSDLDSKKSCPKTVQSGVDLLARIKIISNSFKNQPSKLIKIQKLKRNIGNSKLKSVSSPSDSMLKSVCDKNKRITFINNQTGVTSNTLSEDVMPTLKTVALSEKNPFANALLTPLLKKAKLEKENSVLKNFVLPNLNSDLITSFETNKEIELYKNMKPKMMKKPVAHINTKNGRIAVIKRYWGIKHRGFKGKYDKIPATKRNMMRKGNIHKLALKNGLIILRKSALKKNNSENTNDSSKKSKEKRVTFKIDVETSPIINLNQNIVKEKPLMKCHPFEVRNKPKSILQLSPSVVQDDGSLFPIEQSSEINSEHFVVPNTKKFKLLRNRRIRIRDKDKTSELEELLSQRKNIIPESMASLSVDVLKLIPDNKKELKKVVDYYHKMATNIVTILGSYAKKTCLQGRIRSDEDFKFLAKKINENVMLKELQIKRLDKLKITESTISKVAEYIHKYMSRFREVYKRKSYDQINHHKSK